jgi:hypothetical protein
MRQDIELLTQTADFVLKYGFLAIGLVLIFIIAPVIYKLAGAKRLAQGTVVFGLAFVIAYGVINLIKVVAPQWISAQRVMISGVVRGVPNGRSVQMKSDLWRVGQAYTKREFDTQQQNVFNFPYLLVTELAPTCLAVAMESMDRNSDTSQLFNIAPVSADDMALNVEIVIEVGKDQDKSILNVWREVDGRKSGGVTRLQPLKDLDPGCASASGASNNEWSIFTRAFAQSTLTDADITQRLQSDDVFARRDARIALSRKKDDNFKLIEQLLARDDNYRLQLGAVVALTGMPEDQKRQLPPNVIAKVKSLQNSTDKTMRDTAAQAIK